MKNSFNSLLGVLGVFLIIGGLGYAVYKIVIVSFTDSAPWFLGVALVVWVLKLNEISLEARNKTIGMREPDDPDFFKNQLDIEQKYRFYSWAVGIGGGISWLIFYKILSGT